jgi:hypothetical protein
MSVGPKRSLLDCAKLAVVSVTDHWLERDQDDAYDAGDAVGLIENLNKNHPSSILEQQNFQGGVGCRLTTFPIIATLIPNAALAR